MACILILHILQNKMKRNYRFPSLPSFTILRSVTVLFIQLRSFHYSTYFYHKFSLLSSLLWLFVLLVSLWSEEQQSKLFPSMPKVWTEKSLSPILSPLQMKLKHETAQHKDQHSISLWHVLGQPWAVTTAEEITSAIHHSKRLKRKITHLL